MDNTPKVDDLLMSMIEQSSEDNVDKEPTVINDDSTQEVESTEDVTLEDETPLVETSDEVNDDLPSEEEVVVSDWDDNTEDNTLEEDVEVYSEIGKAIGLEANSKNDIISEFQSIRSENEKLKAQVEQKSNLNIPDQLKEAIEIAEAGGDYLDYLGVAEVDYNKIPDQELLISQVRSYFPEGEEGDEEVKDWLDSMTPAEQRIQAGRLRRSLEEEKANAKEQRLSQIKKSNLEKEEFIKAEKRKLKDTVDKMDSISDFKLTKAHKTRIFDDISNGKITEKLFGVSKEGSTNYEKMAEAYFKTVYFDKIVSYLKSKTANESKKKILQETSNANIGKNGSQVSGSNERDGLDLLINSFK